MSIRQPIPRITPEDVERVVRRDFRPDECGAAMEILGGYGPEGWHREQVRVQVAALKLAGGSLEKLRSAMEVAKRDYRDVLAAAEYPGHSKVGWDRRLGEQEKARIFAADWRQYEDWLRG